MVHWTVQQKHDLRAIDRKPRKGRNLFDGYTRGCGLQFGNLPQLCMNDPDFQLARALSDGRTIIEPVNLMNLFLLIKFYLPKLQHGHIVEFGSYKGGGAIFMAALAKKFLKDVNVWAFDTFSGMPPTDPSIDAHHAGDFKEVSLPSLRNYVRECGLTNLNLVQGSFEQTLPITLPQIGPIALAHIDCDIHSALQCAYDGVKPSMVSGGYVVLDDPLTSSCIGALEAMEDSIIQRDGLHAEQAFPHMVFRYPPLPSEGT